MIARLRKIWESRSPRDRMVITVLAAVVALMLYLWLVQSAYRARAQLGASVSTLRPQAIRLDRDAAEIERLRAIPAAPAPQTDLRTLVQARIEAAGLARGLLRIDAQGANQVQVVFGAVVFADWLRWVASLQSERIRVETGRIEALSTAGMVGLTATLTRASAQ